MIHELKTHIAPFGAVLSGDKKFEFRRNDRGFRLGDRLLLRELNHNREDYTGREIMCFVTYIILGDGDEPSFGVPSGFCVMSIQIEGKGSKTP